MTRRDSTLYLFPKALLLLIGVLLLSSPSFAQDPIPTAADPSSAEQETFDLEVTVMGDNFDKKSEVRFLRTGTEDSGGITVKNVKAQGPKILKVLIDVSAEAAVDDFDIEVMSRGRTGKGTELFRVLEKTNPTQDTTPPGEPTDLLVYEVKYGSALISWTMPWDDGYDVTSGPVQYCRVTDNYPEPLGDPFYNCTLGAAGPGPWWVGPGEQQICLEQRMKPEMTYQLGVTCVDEAGNWSTEALFPPITTPPYSDYQDTSWTIEEVPISVGALLGHEFNGGGDPVMAGIVITGSGKGRWKPVPTAIRVVTGVWSDAFGYTWTSEDVEGFANRMRIAPDGSPVFVGLNVLDPVNLPGGGITFNRELVYTFHDGTDWTTEVVVADAGYYSGIPGLVFDADGNPAVSWCYESTGAQSGIRLARRIASEQWTVEEVNSAACEARSYARTELAQDSDGNPVILYRLKEDGAIRLARGSGGSWVEERVEDPLSVIGNPGSPALFFDTWRSDFVVAGDSSWLIDICERDGQEGWKCNGSFYGGIYDSGVFGNMSGRYTNLGMEWLGQDQGGELFLAYSTQASPDVALARRLPESTAWAIEYVDHPTTRGFDGDVPGQEGPFLALDALNSPSLSWTWDGQLYFAWKETP